MIAALGLLFLPAAAFHGGALLPSSERLRVQFLRTHLNIADFFTKALPMPAFGDYKASLMGHESNNNY